MQLSHLAPADRQAVESFQNFLSWGERPAAPPFGPLPETAKYARRAVPPAWWAYAFGISQYCPPRGEL